MELLEEFPVDRASESSDDVSRNGEKYVEREFRDVREGFSDLNSPAGI